MTAQYMVGFPHNALKHTTHGDQACTMIFDDSVYVFYCQHTHNCVTDRIASKGIASASAWLPLLYDTIVLILTLKRTLGPVRNKTAGKIAQVLLRDGILYYRCVASSISQRPLAEVRQRTA